MKRCVLGIGLLALAAFHTPVRAEFANYSQLATSKLASPQSDHRLVPAPATPELWLAQRVIEREWGASEESTYVEIELPGYKSEGWALALSGALPGAGQLYVGEGSGWWFLAGEVAGWPGRQLLYRKADRTSADAARFVGDPHDTSSVFSFARYRFYAGGSTDFLETLWNSDRDSYYAALERDPQYLVGFSGARPELTFTSFRNFRESRDRSLVRARYLETAIILNHLYAAWDAMRAARFHNLPLERKSRTQLKLGERWGDAGPELRAALVRSF